MPRVLVLGGSGMLGHKLVQVFDQTFETYCTIRGSLEWFERTGILPAERVVVGIEADDFSSVELAIRNLDPHVVINAIGIVKQLPSSQDIVDALRVNSVLPRQIEKLSEILGFRFITISTDCVFSGKKGSYTEGDQPDCNDLYGLSKYLGEVTGRNSLTIRTSIIGRELRSSHGLVEWFLSQQGPIAGYSNATFSGFPTIILAELIEQLILEFPSLQGLYHVSSEPISKYNLLNLIKDRLGLKVEIDNCESPYIDRSLDSTRFVDATGFVRLPWREMVDKMFNDPTPYEDWH